MSRHGHDSDFRQGKRDFERNGRYGYDERRFYGAEREDRDYQDGFAEARRTDERRKEEREEEEAAERRHERKQTQRRREAEYEEQELEAQRQAEAEAEAEAEARAEEVTLQDRAALKAAEEGRQ